MAQKMHHSKYRHGAHQKTHKKHKAHHQHHEKPAPVSDDKIEHQLNVVAHEIKDKRKEVHEAEKQEEIKELVKNQMDTILHKDESQQLERRIPNKVSDEKKPEEKLDGQVKVSPRKKM